MSQSIPSQKQRVLGAVVFATTFFLSPVITRFILDWGFLESALVTIILSTASFIAMYRLFGVPLWKQRPKKK